MFSHALDLLHPGTSLHGEQCGIGAIMMMHLHKGDWKEIRDSLRTMGAPTTAEELGHDSEDIVDALMMARDVRKDRYTILSAKELTRKKAESIAKATGVI